MQAVRLVGFNTGVNFVARTGNQQHKANEIGTSANNQQEHVSKPKNAEVTGSVAFESQDSTAQTGQNFMAMA